jgi:hypothetical protein
MGITKKKYRGKVEVLTRANLKWSNFVVPEGMTVDHKFPVSMGHKLGIPPEYIADLRNIQFLSITENISKGNKCTFIPIYIQKYLLGIASNEIIMSAREKQMEGIKRAKELGRYTGRKVGSKETPELFFEKAMSLGSILSQKTYSDHHRFSKEELKQMNSVALNMFEDQAFLTTHKDFVRFQDHFQEFPQLRNKLYYLPMEMFFLDGEKGFWAWLGAKFGR